MCRARSLIADPRAHLSLDVGTGYRAEDVPQHSGCGGNCLLEGPRQPSAGAWGHEKSSLERPSPGAGAGHAWGHVCGPSSQQVALGVADLRAAHQGTWMRQLAAGGDHPAPPHPPGPRAPVSQTLVTPAWRRDEAPPTGTPLSKPSCETLLPRTVPASEVLK